MPLNKEIQPGDNDELTRERLQATFDTQQMAAVLWDGDLARKRRELAKKVDRLTVLHDSKDMAFMTREEKLSENARKVVQMFAHLTDLIEDPSDYAEVFHLSCNAIGHEGHPLAVHFVMFIPALQAQADDEQKEKWLMPALGLQLIGTYAQTELGHGTNLRALETTATFDEATDEFVIHTPTVTALKWWPGNLGKSSNYAIVSANLVIDGKAYGHHNFMVQLRDENTHKPLKGITVGDIGPKMAYNASDNGFLGFDHHRIPRRNMLMRHAKVDRNGAYTKPSHAKIGYSAMVHVRSVMIGHQGMFLGAASTIAIRYSLVRRQGEIKDGSGEVKILDYQTQQHRLFPQLARAYVFTFAGKEVRELYQKVLNDMEKGETTLLADLHALTSGLKSVVTHLCGAGMEQCRMACGGHGYSRASGIPEIWGVAVGGCTYEGENMVMLLQLARYLMKAVKEAKKGKSLGRLVDYLLLPQDRHSLIGRVPQGEYGPHLAAFEHIARRQIFKVADELVGLQGKGMSKEIAWQAKAVELQRAARLHTRFYLAACFHRKVQSAVDGRIREALADLYHLHLNYELLDMVNYALEDAYLMADQVDFIREDMYRLLETIRPNAISLVDAFEFTDRELRSVLGRRDGHVYENLYKWARESELNRTDVLPYFDKYLKPMMLAARQRSNI